MGCIFLESIMSILEAINDPSNTALQIFLLSLAGFRIYLEIIRFNFEELPMTKIIFRASDSSKKFHRMGLYLSVGFILTSAPSFLFA